MKRTDVTFQGVDLKFNWTNEDWALTWLPHIRVAAVTLVKDDEALQTVMAELVRGGVVPEMLDGWCETKEHLKALVELLDTALARSFVVLGRLGYEPDNPPPDSSVH